MGVDFPLEDDFEVGEPVDLGDNVPEALYCRAIVDFGKVTSFTVMGYYLEEKFQCVFIKIWNLS